MNQYIFNDSGDLEVRRAGSVIRTYTFDPEGILQVQHIAKCDLAYFYQRTPFAFRSEIECLFIMSVKRRNYTAQEVRKIFDHLGIVTRADVQSALPRIIDYHKQRRNQNLNAQQNNGD